MKNWEILWGNSESTLNSIFYGALEKQNFISTIYFTIIVFDKKINKKIYITDPCN